MSVALPAPAPKKPWYRASTFWIFVGLALGVALGGALPQDAHPQAYDAFAFLSKAFIGLIKGLIVPLLFSTLVVGIAQTMFKYTDIVMFITPIGVFGAIAYNVSHMASGQTIDGAIVKGWPAVVYLLRQYALLVGSLYLSLGVLAVTVFVPILLLVR